MTSFERIREINEQLDDLARQITALSVERRKLIRALATDGHSQRAIAAAVGLTSGRISQLNLKGES